MKMTSNQVEFPIQNAVYYLNEANFLGIAAEALSAAHESILSNNCMRITTHTAATHTRNSRSTTQMAVKIFTSTPF
uniref:Putative ovule protein n=1 Tax=Solanum chacoense TaxID=4108 RepID=A0A0V0GR06_SOLCH